MEQMQQTSGVDGDSGIDLVVFAVRGQRFAVESRHVRSIADLHHSRDTTAPALADLLGLTCAPGTPQTPGTRTRLLRVGPATQDRAATFDMQVEEPIALYRTPIGALYPLPSLVAALSALPCVRGLVRLSTTRAEDLAVLIDPRRIRQEDRVAAPGQRAAAHAAS